MSSSVRGGQVGKRKGRRQAVCVPPKQPCLRLLQIPSTFGERYLEITVRVLTVIKELRLLMS